MPAPKAQTEVLQFERAPPILPGRSMTTPLPAHTRQLSYWPVSSWQDVVRMTPYESRAGPQASEPSLHELQVAVEPYRNVEPETADAGVHHSHVG